MAGINSTTYFFEKRTTAIVHGKGGVILKKITQTLLPYQLHKYNVSQRTCKGGTKTKTKKRLLKYRKKKNVHKVFKLKRTPLTYSVTVLLAGSSPSGSLLWQLMDQVLGWTSGTLLQWLRNQVLINFIFGRADRIYMLKISPNFLMQSRMMRIKGHRPWGSKIITDNRLPGTDFVHLKWSTLHLRSDWSDPSTFSHCKL